MHRSTVPCFNGRVKAIIAGAAALVCVGATSYQGNTFTLDPKGAALPKMSYYPIKLALQTEKPAQIVREPQYRTAPKYAVIRLGNGPNSDFVAAFDEPADADWKVYVDRNHNGDLTDDGDGAWRNKSVSTARTQYGALTVHLRASYGTKAVETSSSEYVIALYRFSNGGPYMFRLSTRTGTVTLDGKPHKAILAENDADALFCKPVASRAEAKKCLPLWMKIDTTDDGTYASGLIDVRVPFKLGETTYEAIISEDGSRVSVEPTTKLAIDLKPPELLKPGVQAPDFVAEKWGGGELKFSDYKGKIIVLEFWSIWSEPSLKSMPHLEAIKKAVEGQDVVFIGVCTWEAKAAYTEWLQQNGNKYTLQWAFDPAAKDTESSIAAKLYHVNGIPAAFVIDRDGSIAASNVGYKDTDRHLEDALNKLGIKTN